MSTTVLVVIVAVAWIGCGPLLAWFMSRRGYDTVAWLAMGSMLGPAALTIAAMERRSSRPSPDEIVVRGTDLGGDANILMSFGAGEGVANVARPLVRSLHGHIGRMTIVRVVPEGGPSEEVELAKRAIRREVRTLSDAEGVLLFGRVDEALKRKALNEGYQFLVTSRRDDRLEAALAGSRIRYLAGGGDVSALGCTGSGAVAPCSQSSTTRVPTIGGWTRHAYR